MMLRAAAAIRKVLLAPQATKSSRLFTTTTTTTPWKEAVIAIGSNQVSDLLIFLIFFLGGSKVFH